MTEIPLGLCQCGCGQKTGIATRNRTKTGWVKGQPFRFLVGHGTPVKHGHSKRRTGVYTAWASMLQRCYNQRATEYEYYGGRGIEVCARWHYFENFYADMGDRPEGLSLDRIDNDKGYSPDNCRWAFRKEQANNTRRNHRVQYLGETFTVTKLAERVGIRSVTLCSRLRLGWPLELAVSVPVSSNNKPKLKGLLIRADHA